jgi:hypothetical protein
LIAAAPAWAASGSATAERAVSPTGLSLEQMTLLGKQVEADPLMPGPGPVLTPFARSLSVEMGKRTVLVTALHVSYPGIRNRYCRLAVSGMDTGAAQIVPLPVRSLNDGCLAVDGQWTLDVNGDGLSDVVQRVRLKSNRSDSTASEAMVYLRSDKAESGFCFSPQASVLLGTLKLQSGASIAAELKANDSRIDRSRMRCAD